MKSPCPALHPRSFTDQPLLDFSTGKQSNNLHHFEVAQAYVLAFFDKYLLANDRTIPDSNTPIDPRAKVDRFPKH